MSMKSTWSIESTGQQSQRGLQRRQGQPCQTGQPDLRRLGQCQRRPTDFSSESLPL